MQRHENADIFVSNQKEHFMGTIITKSDKEVLHFFDEMNRVSDLIDHLPMDNRHFLDGENYLTDPELAGKPMAVGGDPEARHGIVLTANYIAKRAGVKTGMALWQARQVCPEIIFVPPRMDLYLRFSRMAQEIYSEYTDQREPFGIDESWLDVTASTSIKGDGMKIAKEISSRIKYELGVTVSNRGVRCAMHRCHLRIIIRR